MDERSKIESARDNLDRRFLDEDCLYINIATEVIHPSGQPGGVKKRALQGSTYTESSEEVMTYCMNNGVLAFVRQGGQYYVTPSTPEKIRMLEAAGYKQSGLGVALSNGEKPADWREEQKWQSLLEKRDKAREQKS